ncbi:MAG: hypothetical protein WKF96_06820 [Solirubrobacteraceae bacterium]
MDKPTLALLLTFGVHVVGLCALFWLALGGSRFDWRSWWPNDDGDGSGEAPAPPERGPDGGALPLPGSDPAGVRLRTEHDRLTDARRRARRPAHAPEPGRTREPV